MASWNLPQALLLELYRRLAEDLPTHADQHLGEPIGPIDSGEYTFVLSDRQNTQPGSAPNRYLFVFAIERYRDDKELHFVGARMVSEV